MRFLLNDNVCKVNERYVGVDCKAQMLTSLDSYVTRGGDSKKRVDVTRQVKSRGSVYLQLNRMVSVDKMKEIIEKF